MKERIISIVITTSLVVLLIGCSHKKEHIIDTWSKYEGNPIIGDEDTGTLFDADVIKLENGLLRMYLSWRPQRAIAICESENGKDWTELQIVLTNDGETGWEDDINRSSVVYHGDIYYMWYTGQHGESSKIGLATSKDGIHFEKYGAPVMVPEYSWEKASIMNPCVIWDDEEQMFKMWYAAGEQYEPNVIAYATSLDGINWSKRDTPIYSKTEKWYERDRIGGCDVVKTDDGYIMFYIGYEDVHTARICVAHSQNGIDQWSESKDNPIVSPELDKWDENACYKPTVLYDEEKDIWMLWYNGRRESCEYIGIVMHPGYDLNF